MLLLPLSLLLGCGGDGKDGSGEVGTDSVDSGDSGGPPCATSVIGHSPDDGATGIDLGGRVSFTLSEADTTATITVTAGTGTASGAEVVGSSWLDATGTTAWFEAAGPLQADTDHTATVHTCAGDAEVGFHTRTVGAPVADLLGTAYLVDIAGAEWINPPNFGSMLGIVLDPKLLIGVAETSGGTLSWIGAPSLDGLTQNRCKATTAFPPADFVQNPYFQIGPADPTITLAGLPIDLHRFKLSGEFTPAGIEGGVVTVGIDVRQVIPALGDLLPVKDVDGFCEKIGGFGITCLPCPDGTGSYCVDLYAEALAATPVAASVDVIAQSDCDPGCEASWTNPECDTSAF